MGLLSSRTGIFCYLLLPNRWVWALLSSDERRRIQAGNLHYHTASADVAAGEQSGVTFDCEPSGASAIARRRELVDFLDRVQPSKVLEIGPGFGLHTRAIVEHQAVRHYTAVDINPACLEFLRPRLEALRKPCFSFSLTAGNVSDLPGRASYDAVILFASVHQIPDRAALFEDLVARLRLDGRILAADPTHYVLRWMHLLRKALQPGYLANTLEHAQAERLSTHAMCQWHEYRAICDRTSLRPVRVAYEGGPRTIRWLRRHGVPLGPIYRWFSQEMLIECVRAPARGA